MNFEGQINWTLSDKVSLYYFKVCGQVCDLFLSSKSVNLVMQ